MTDHERVYGQNVKCFYCGSIRTQSEGRCRCQAECERCGATYAPDDGDCPHCLETEIVEGGEE
jgi:hypothetical protein